MKKRPNFEFTWLAAATCVVILAFSCALPSTTDLVAEVDNAKKLNASTAPANLHADRIVGVAAIGDEGLFFEFDTSGTKKKAHALLPAEASGYVQDGKVRYRDVAMDIIHFSLDEKGNLFGMTSTKDGVSYSFGGTYSPTQGFSGMLYRNVNGSPVGSGYFAGMPVPADANATRYIGQATYLFETPTPQTLLFYAVKDNATGAVQGLWSETGVGWGYSLLGFLWGSMTGKNFEMSATVFPEFRLEMLYDMNASGTGSFTNPSEKDLSGYFTIKYGEQNLPSTLAVTEVKVKD